MGDIINLLNRFFPCKVNPASLDDSLPITIDVGIQSDSIKGVRIVLKMEKPIDHLEFTLEQTEEFISALTEAYNRVRVIVQKGEL